MSKKALIKFLNRIQKKIVERDDVSEINNLICIDFISPIFESNEVSTFFRERLFYYDELIQNQSYKSTQNKLHSVIGKLGLLLNTPILLRHMAKHYEQKYKLANPFNTAIVHEAESTDMLSVNDFLKLAVDPKSYYLLRGNNPNYGSQEISIRTPVVAVLKQFKAVQKVMKLVYKSNQDKLSNVNQNEIESLLFQYEELLVELEVSLIHKPEKLHLKEYEYLYRIFAKYNPKSLFPNYYKAAAFFPATNVKKAKEAVEVVYNDLLLNLPKTINKVEDNASKVIFNEKNGAVYINGEHVGNLTPSTKEYYFFLKLFAHLGTPVNHNDLNKFVCEKTNTVRHSRGAQSMANRLRSDIGKTLKRTDEIISSTKDISGNNAYIMR